MSWLTGKLDGNARWAYISLDSTNIFLVFSFFALLVMNFDRYLATSHPIFHRTSVTKGRLLTLLAILIIVEITLAVMTVNNFVISYQVHVLILFIPLIPAMLFINYSLMSVSSRQEKQKNFARAEKDVFFQKYIELFTGSRLCCGIIHSMVRLHWIKIKLARDSTYFG